MQLIVRHYCLSLAVMYICVTNTNKSPCISIICIDRLEELCGFIYIQPFCGICFVSKSLQNERPFYVTFVVFYYNSYKNVKNSKLVI